MGDRTVATTLCVLLILSVIPFTFDNAFAKDFKKHVTAEELGILQLAAHDLFNVDRCGGDASCSEDFENGKLDLSTLFVDTTENDEPFDNNIIALGGEVRNRENIMLFTVASDFGETYVELINEGVDPLDAKDMIVLMYHEKLSDTYQKTFDEQFPEPMEGDATFQENLALRSIHDFLPEKIKFNKKSVSIFDSSLKGEKLDKKELNQKSSKLDGKFDDEFLNIHICFPPDNVICIDVDLLEADRTFGEQFGIEFSFDDCLEELEDGSYDEDDTVMVHIRNLMAKGQNF